MRKQQSRFPNRFDRNWSVQSQNQARRLKKNGVKRKRVCTIYMCSENKCSVTGFAYADWCFSDAVNQLSFG